MNTWGFADCTGAIAIAPDEIQIWRVPLSGQPGAEDQLKEILPPDQLARASRFHYAHDRRRFIIRRAVLRQLLAACLQTTPSAIRLSLGTHGKPAITGQTGANGLRFSSSHSADWALIAIARGIELGVDLEQHRPMNDVEDLVKNCFSEAEISELSRLPQALKAAGFINGWTRKEAFVKAIGLGLSYPLNRIAVSLVPGRPAALLAVADDPDAIKKWTLISLDAFPHYSAALVFENKHFK